MIRKKKKLWHQTRNMSKGKLIRSISMLKTIKTSSILTQVENDDVDRAINRLANVYENWDSRNDRSKYLWHMKEFWNDKR
jgi:hypothetical protein